MTGADEALGHVREALAALRAACAVVGLGRSEVERQILDRTVEVSRLADLLEELAA